MPIAQTASGEELTRDYSTWPQQSFHALYEIAKIRHLRDHVVADQAIRLHAVVREFRAKKISPARLLPESQAQDGKDDR
jgi:hypothetical protein